MFSNSSIKPPFPLTQWDHRAVLVTTAYLKTNKKYFLLFRALANLFCKSPGNKYVRFCGPQDLSCSD